jgi:hypothetical protein
MRHMNIPYFFAVDVKRRGHIIIKYCPTDEMIGDFFNKPLGGAKFQRMRNIIMNCYHDDFGPVNMDELMAEHGKRTCDRHDVIDNEPTISKASDTVGSQECVGARSKFKWVQPGIAHRNAHQNIMNPHLPNGMSVVYRGQDGLSSLTRAEMTAR